MNFRQRSRDEPEINLIPFIDVLLVVLIFLMLSTTSITLAPGCRWTFTNKAAVSFDQAPSREFSASSRVSATSDSRTGRPFW
jgi:biopolymer transport protein ExbD